MPSSLTYLSDLLRGTYGEQVERIQARRVTATDVLRSYDSLRQAALQQMDDRFYSLNSYYEPEKDKYETLEKESAYCQWWNKHVGKD